MAARAIVLREYLKLIIPAETYTLAEAFVNSGKGHPMSFRVLCKVLHARVGMSGN